LRLGTADDRFAIQFGKKIVYVDGGVSIADVLALLGGSGARGGDET